MLLCMESSSVPRDTGRAMSEKNVEIVREIWHVSGLVAAVTSTARVSHRRAGNAGA
jgi:hypothetical protein